MTELAAKLERLYAELDAPARLAADPVAYPHRYEDPRDREVAALFAALLAYGRVAAFRPVLDQIFARFDARGGPRAFVEAFEPDDHGRALRPLYYRWNRGGDFVLLCAALRALYARVPSLEALLGAEALPAGLDPLVDALRAEAVAASPRCGVEATSFAELPRGFRALVPRPAEGSACKRWFMFLRWMIRPPREGVDLGLWTSRSPAELVVPLDTHVLRLAGFLGLTTRADGSLRTALEVTAALRRLDPEDPVRFDFALAHLGISGSCRGYREPTVCPGCTLVDVCIAE